MTSPPLISFLLGRLTMDYTALPPRDLAVAVHEISRSVPLVAFFSLLLPAAPTHLPLVYHTPRHHAPVTRLVLSVTATPGVYAHLSPTTALFLHRPWDLDRRRLSPSTLVLTSHQRLDELLTTGHNTPLLHRLGCTGAMVPIVGYKNDPTRKIGLVARLPTDHTLEHWVRVIHDEFQGLDPTPDSGEPITPAYIACMNAFEPDLIDRTLRAAADLSPAAGEPVSPRQIIYLTGQPRAPGLVHARALGMPVLFTGHRRAELWAVRWLARRVEEVLGLHAVVVDELEEEEEMQRRKREQRGKAG